MKATDWNAVVATVNEIEKENKKSKATHQVIEMPGGRIACQGTLAKCKMYVAANEPFFGILGKTVTIEKIKK